MSDFDVVIVGAGISGIGSAYHLKTLCPGKTYTILESREDLGGTWDLFRYPGIRSDSDMHTLGYSFKPWRAAKSIADGPAIREYLHETVAENDIRRHIQFNQTVTAADWSSDDQQWTVTAETDSQSRTLTCNMLLMCSGYYNYAEGYTPEFEGMHDYQGTVVHPQHWPEDLDYAGKKVVVIGSGATAMTLVPAMADQAASVTMLQRSPTYVVSRPDQDKIANTLRKILPENWAYAVTRFKNTQMQNFIYKRSRTAPEKMKTQLVGMVKQALGPDYDVDKHFTPSYNPWDQRLCLIPNADLFESINSGKTTVVTEQIERLTAEGVQLKNGDVLPADILVTATGLNLQLLGGAQFSVDGKPVNFPETVTYKGMMYSDIPNLVQTFGYVNASWTLRADLTAEFACRVINHMDERGVTQVTPVLREEDKDMQLGPWIEDFSAGYMSRVMHLFPKQGDRDPWRNTQDYQLDKKIIRKAALEDGALQFGPQPRARQEDNQQARSAA
ncbi:MAG: NAD(P)/FAD-dependent oxidoreductase [Pseudomonadaceae bacterium]|nr:NAD(P)/FAD-dependent oxidoreductase [Pseudomonadaceae bacterium]